MAFDDSSITDGPTCRQTLHHELRVSWSSSAPPGTAFQVYVDRRLAYSGTNRLAFLPLPTAPVRVWVGAVAPGEKLADFSATLADPHGAGDRAELAWLGGRYLDATLASFNIYGGPDSSAFGGGSFGRGGFGDSVPVASVFASHAGLWLDGFGRGRFGEGGFGHAEVSYSWRSGPLPTGAYTFLVAPMDAAGNEGPASPIAVAVAAPPGPPAPLSTGGRRVSYAFDPSTLTVTLDWGTSPG